MNIVAGSSIVCLDTDEEDIFAGTEVYIYQNEPQAGTIGFITNRHSVYKLSDPAPDLIEQDAPIFYGGPVQDESLFIVHQYPAILSYDQCVNGVCISSDFEELRYHLKRGKVNLNKIKLLMGYCGWDEGELITEVKEGMWRVKQAGTANLFQKDIAAIRL